MSSIVELWRSNSTYLSDKKLQQILGFTGDGRLRDGNATSSQFREYLSVVPNYILTKHAEECLSESFQDSGLVLQDIVNEIGRRLGFDVFPGKYRGTTVGIGHDGLWCGSDSHNLVIEVKTTDAYRINLDTIAAYRKGLVESGQLSMEASSILIVLGRQDTGDLEAQIRGSRHAWDVRLISTDSLVGLLSLKEKLNDPRTLHQITQILKPNEYTRIDKLVDLVFTTATDVELDEDLPDHDEDVEFAEEVDTQKREQKKFTPVNFHQQCVERIQEKLNATLVKQSKSAYNTSDKSLGVNVAVSKLHEAGNTRKYWFAFHPHQREFLKGFSEPYVAFGCGSSAKLLLIPLQSFEQYVPDLWTTERGDRSYWHVVIYERENTLELRVPRRNQMVDMTKYKV